VAEPNRVATRRHRHGLERAEAPLDRGRSCGGRLQIVAYLHSHVAIKKILDHLGLSPPEQERPPAEIRYVPTDDEGHELSGMVAEAPPAP
jgi:hypothetical protein